MKSVSNGNKPLPLSLRVVPDTSIIIDGFLSKKIEAGEMKVSEVLIHEAVLAELESQANKNRETGFLGLEEVKRLRGLAFEMGFSLYFKGKRPTDFEIKHARAGEIDSLIRQLAFDDKATLLTADKVQSLVAESKGLPVMLCEVAQEEAVFALDKYFDASTMSVHVREKCTPMAKKGLPGSWTFERAGSDKLGRDAVKELAKKIVEDASLSEKGFVESDRKGSTIVQFENNRVVIARPPFSDGYEITCVRPVKTLTIEDYALTQKAILRIDESAEGILIAGSPGSGKSTFAQALSSHYLAKGKVVKTVESPRDLAVSEEVTQLSLSHGSALEVQDYLLLSRPDYTIYDEMRGTEDFRLFSDLRLSGVGMVGVMHATRPIDAIQRFIGRIDLGVIPHVIDTVIFIKDGRISKMFTLSLEVRVPSGMSESDLARPIVFVNDFENGKLEFEIYTFGEETVVVPVTAAKKAPASRIAEEVIKKYLLDNELATEASVEMLNDYRCRISVPVGERLGVVGTGGFKISEVEKRFGISMDVTELALKKASKRDERIQNLKFKASVDKKNILLDLGEKNADQDVDIYIDGEFFFSAKCSKRGVINVSLGNAIGKMLNGSLTSGRIVEVRGS